MMNREEAIKYIEDCISQSEGLSLVEMNRMGADGLLKMLKADAPKPDFYVGWKGTTADEYKAEIFGEKHGDFYGVSGSKPMCWAKDGGSRYDETHDLIPNTPPEPEIWYREKSHPADLYDPTPHELEQAEATHLEKVEVRVIK